MPLNKKGFKGSMKPKGLTMATDAKLKQLKNTGFRQGKDYEVVSKKIALGKSRGGSVKKKVSKMIKGLKKASKTHAGQARTLSSIKKRIKV
jgi:hypothetical protein